jgi:hypothetical protein
VRLYVSGPITGYPEHNKPLFDAVSDKLRGAGHEVLNPHDVCTVLGEHDCLGPCVTSDALLPWEDYLRADLSAMLQRADGLAMLPGWENSRGALLERHVAIALGWPIQPWEDWL